MSWATSRLDLRRLLSDGEKDKLRHRKRVFGNIDGTNATFKTFEFRRLTDFTSATSPEGVYVNSVAVPVTSDDQSNTGEFVLTTAPVDGDVVDATYFIQWFLDEEIDGFLQDAANWIGNTIADDIPPGLRPAALHYGAQEAYQKLALRWAEYISEVYRLEDAPRDSSFKMVEQYEKSAQDMHKKSFDLRDDYYKRSGRSLQPLFGIVQGAVVDPVPKR